jgi:tight junction protein 1
VNDRIISANGISLENVDYATAVQVLRDSGNTVTLVVKRRAAQPGAMVNGNSFNQASPLGNHQHSHSLSSAGLIGANGSQNQYKVLITKSNKKEDFGIVLGCRLFIKEISSKTRDQLQANGYSLQEGDIVTRIHNSLAGDTMSIKEARKIMDGCKERLNLTVIRDQSLLGPPVNTTNNNASSMYSHQQQLSNCSNIDSSYSTQNLYVQPPTRPSLSTLLDDKCNLTPRGRSRGPLTDISLSQLDLPSTPQTQPGVQHARTRSTVDEPPRPPPPRNDDYYSTRRPPVENAEPRYITFQKEGSVGIRLTGGLTVGIFVTAVQPNSPAALQGLVPGDKILKVNDMDMSGATREEAVLFLLSLQDRIDLIVQYCKEEYDNVIQNQKGDSFHIKTHFHYQSPSKSELSFRAGEIFYVVDTLHNGVVGSWQVLRIGRGHQELQRGIIPNKARAEELATAQFNASKKELNTSESRVSFFRRKKTGHHRRSKSLNRENWDDVVFSDSISKFPAYERVVLRHPGFVRPVVLFGPTADLAREKLIKDFPDKFTAPLQDDDKTQSKCGIVRLSNIRDIMDRGKHALLDVTPNAVDRLNYAQFYPIVIFLKTDSKHTIKQLRQGIPKSAHKSSKKLLEQCLKLDQIWSHVFSATVNLNDTESWYRKLRDIIDQQQSGAVWMSETKVRFYYFCSVNLMLVRSLLFSETISSFYSLFK